MSSLNLFSSSIDLFDEVARVHSTDFASNSEVSLRFELLGEMSDVSIFKAILLFDLLRVHINWFEGSNIVVFLFQQRAKNSSFEVILFRFSVILLGVHLLNFFNFRLSSISSETFLDSHVFLILSSLSHASSNSSFISGKEGRILLLQFHHFNLMSRHVDNVNILRPDSQEVHQVMKVFLDLSELLGISLVLSSDSNKVRVFLTQLLKEFISVVSSMSDNSGGVS